MDYIKLCVDVELNDEQQHIWHSTVNKFIDAIPEYVNDDSILDDNFPFTYSMNITDELTVNDMNLLAKMWGHIYPRDFEIDTSIDFECDDCDVDMSDETLTSINEIATKFLHNRWVDDQISEGWRFGLVMDSKDKTNPKLRDWDTLNEQLRPSLNLTKEQAFKFVRENPYIFS